MNRHGKCIKCGGEIVPLRDHLMYPFITRGCKDCGFEAFDEPKSNKLLKGEETIT